MSDINVIGIDLGKNTFHLIGHDQTGKEVFRKKLNRIKLIQFLSTLESTIKNDFFFKQVMRIDTFTLRQEAIPAGKYP